MKTTTLVTVLTSLTKAMAVAAPVVVFGFLYVTQVQPQRAAALNARNALTAVRYELDQRRLSVTPQTSAAQASALDEFDARTTDANGIGEVSGALTAILKSPSIGRVSNVSIARGAPADGAGDSMVRVFSRPLVHTPFTLTFDARYEQIGRFLWNLRMLPTTFDLQSLELSPATGSREGLMHVKVLLLAFHRPGTAALKTAAQPQTVDVTTAPQRTRDPLVRRPATDVPAHRTGERAEPDPVVNSILVSNGRRVALVDGRIVRRGDRVRSGVIESIERDAVVIAGAGGATRRVEIERPMIRLAAR